MGEVLKLSFEQKEELAEVYDEQKLEYEASLATALTAFFIRIGRDFTNIYSATSEIIDANEYSDELTGILKESYLETSDYFSKHFERGLTQQLDTDDPKLLESTALSLAILNIKRPQIDKDIIQYINTQTPIQAGYILDTTNEVFDKSILQAIESLELEEIDINSSSVGRASGKIANERNLNRVGTIKETEIANASSESMSTEARNLQEGYNDQGLAFEILKQWITKLDSAVRPSHVSAHGQARETTKLFNVGGEELMYPTDTSHGASLGNTINCRCLSINT